MGVEDKLLGFLKEQITVENQIVKSLNQALVNIENQAVKGTLKGISLDSLKHAQMYASAVNLLTKVPKTLTQEELDEQRRLIEKHIELEVRLIKRINRELPSVKNEKVKLLLNAILQDEKRHHDLLKQENARETHLT
ncbi:hypothetical protein B6U79_04385 [Candidatus Bathyarchaeota archaeon ex4484_231]|nr:MAG: hypothetical protein B6U79_04385 [Candidatus Bathyarchaeota archaeon ex4484_231]